MARDSDKNTFATTVNARLASPKPKQLDEWVASAAPRPQEDFHNFSARPRTTGSPRPQLFAKNKEVADALNAPIFPDGKPKYERTKLAMPQLGKDAEGNPTVTPSSINNQYLSRISGGSEAFVAEQKRNFEAERAFVDGTSKEPTGFEQNGSYGYGLDPSKEELRKQTVRRKVGGPMPNMIDFERRDSPVPITDTKEFNPRYYPVSNKIAGVDPSLLGSSPHEKVPTSREDVALRAKNGLPLFGPVNPSSAVNTLGHEANHSYLNVIKKSDKQVYEGPPSDSPNFQDDKEAGTYQTSDDSEWTQGVTSGLNGMRDITGMKLNTPFEVHKLLDEVEKTPAILDNLSDENARIFRSYLKINKENPKSGKRIRESMARDSKYLVQNDSAEVLKSYRGRLS
jgi:hypothetical protein